MRILILTNFYPPHELGGQGRSCHQVVEGLVRRGHEVLVVTSRNGVGKGPTSDGGICRCLHLEMDLSPLKHSLIFFTLRRNQEIENLQILERCIDEYQPDVLFFWGMWNLSRKLPALAERKCPGRVVYRFAEYWPILPNQHKLYWQAPARTWYSKLLKGSLRKLALAQLANEEPPPPLKFEYAICVSAATRDTLIEAGVPLEQAQIIHTGLDLEQYQANGRLAAMDEAPVKALFAGRLSDEKGAETVIRAMHHVVHECGVDNVILSMAGSGADDYEQHLHRLVSKYKLESRISFLGWIPHESMPALMQRYDVLIVPSKWPEPFARSLLEGMASGLAIIATPNGGSSEIIQDGENGLLFDAEEMESLAKQLVRLVVDRSLRMRLQENGRRTITERFTFNRMLDSYESYLNRVAHGQVPLDGDQAW